MKKPWFWKKRGAWFVTSEDGRSQTRLHDDEKKAYEIWHELSETADIRAMSPCVVLIQEFLIESKKSLSPDSYANHERYLLAFAKFTPRSGAKYGTIAVRDLKPSHVTKWLDGKPWSPSTIRTAISRVVRCFAWAVGQGYIATNPLAGVKRPPESRRERMITDDEHTAMMTAGKKGHRYSKRVAALRPVLIALRHSGARPSSVSNVTAKHVSPAGDAWVFAAHKTRAKTQRPLIVYLSPCLQTLTRIAAAVRSKGPLFTNAHGRPWNRNSIRQRIKRLRKSLGLDSEIVSYSYRHTFITNALLAGVDMATVAELAGHRSLEMLARHYAHLGQATEHLKTAARTANRRNQATG